MNAKVKTARQVQPCGTRAAYQRHRLKGETPCEPCAEAKRAYSRVSDPSPRSEATVQELIEEIEFLLNAGEGESRILQAIGYAGRISSLKARLTKAGRADLMAKILNSVVLAA